MNPIKPDPLPEIITLLKNIKKLQDAREQRDIELLLSEEMFKAIMTGFPQTLASTANLVAYLLVEFAKPELEKRGLL